nr:MAG TPA: hypothetical protein [Caudoviricetes sp.]
MDRWIGYERSYQLFDCYIIDIKINGNRDSIKLSLFILLYSLST